MRILLRLFRNTVVNNHRWNISHVPAIIDRKIDMANIDNSGSYDYEVEVKDPEAYLKPFVLY